MRRILVWLLFIAVILTFVLFHYEGKAIGDFYAEIYHNKMLVAYEYTRRVTSDVYVAVTNNVYYLEQSLDKPDSHKATMERIVKSGTRIRSCGISFIKDYYPEKGHRFCPFAWRNAKNQDIIYSENMGDADLDYLHADWFLDIIKSDSAQWSEPFYDGYDNKTALSAYMVPIHDAQGRTIAVLGADVSLDWLTNKLAEVDSTLNDNDMLMASAFGLKSSSCIIYRDGTFITNTDEERIMTDNFFSHLESCDDSDVEALVGDMKAGIVRENRNQEKFLVDGEECFVFYSPMKYTNWVMVTMVPCHAIEVLGVLNAGTLFLIILLSLVILVLVAGYYIKDGMNPIRQLTKSVSDMGEGKFDTPMPELKHNDEIGQLRDAIENMQYAVSNYVDKAKE